MQFHHIFKQVNEYSSLFYAWFQAMHTRVDIVICDFSEAESVQLLERVYNEIKRIELLADRFNADSEIGKMNRFAPVELFVISEELYLMLENCIEYNLKTFGAFDVTIQSLNNHRQGIKDIVLDPEKRAVFFKNKNVQVDLCGYIKGYALDRVKTMFLDCGSFNALINIGNSSVCALGNHPNGKGWKINVPSGEKKIVTLFDQCLSTSENSDDYRHIINPETGEACEYAGTMSVITGSATGGEVLATALCASKPELREVICRNLGGRILVNDVEKV